MARERTLFISRPENLSYLNDEYRRIYFGDEFCERLLPATSAVTRVIQAAEDRGLQFSLVTPYATPAGISRIASLLPLLPEGTEVVFNDWGVLRMLKRDFPTLVPVMGRLLTKIKRGPRIAGFLDTLPAESLAHYRRTNLGVPIYQEFLRAQGIGRVELDNPLQGLDLRDVPPDIRLSLYIPFAYVTTTRFCLTANVDKPDKKGFIGVFPCNQECRTYTFYLDNAAMHTLLIRRGNTLFYRNTKIDPAILESHMDRVVIQPEIPH